MGRYLDIGGTRYLLEQLHDIMEKMLVGDVDLSDYVTKTELQKILDELNIDIDLSNYVTKEELEDALADIDTSNIDLSAYATKEYVTDAINNAELGGDGSSVDLSIYAKKTDLDAKADEEHTHTMSDITDYVAPDLSAYATREEIPSLDGYATEEYVDNAIADVAINGEVDLSDYATTDYVDTAISNIELEGVVGKDGKSAYEIFLDSKTMRTLISGDIITADDGVYLKEVTEDAEVGTITSYVLGENIVRYNFDGISTMLDEYVETRTWNKTITYGYNVHPDSTVSVILEGIPEPTEEDRADYNTWVQVPYVDLLYFSDKTLSGWSKSVGEHWYRFIKHYVYDEELDDNVEMWIPYLMHYDENLNVVYDISYYINGYLKNDNGYERVNVIKIMSSDKSLPFLVYYNPNENFSLSNKDKEALRQMFLIMKFNMKQIPITEKEWLESLKGEDGSVSFENLTDAQKAELKGDKGDKGDTGKDGTDGRGILSTTYEYGSSGNTATKPTEWYTTVGEVPTNYYRWTKQTVLYTDETSDIGYFVTKVVDSSEGDYATKEELVNYYTKSEVDTLIPNVSDGEDGTDGITPHIDETTKHWFIGETDTGVLAEGINGVDGTNGQDGADGYTPVRGTDYWTEQDIQTIKDYIDTELGVIENGSY